MNSAITRIGQGLAQAWGQLAEGWRELVNRSGQALTKFTHRETARGAGGLPRWSLLAGEVIDEGKSIVVRLEVPGVEKEDLQLEIRGRALLVRGERRLERDRIGHDWVLTERAYGRFERVVALPCEVEADKAEATLRHGVLTVRAPRSRAAAPRRLLPVR